MKKIKIRLMSFISCFIITFISVCSPVFAAESSTPVFDGLSLPKQVGIVLMSYPDLVKLSFKSLGAVISGNPTNAVNTMMQYPATVEELAKLASGGKLQKGSSGTYYSPITKDASGYKIPSELVNESKVMLDRYVQETDGYYIVPVDSPSSISVGLFRSQSFYTELMNYFNSHPDDVFLNFDYSSRDYFNMFNLSSYKCYCTGTANINSLFYFTVLNPDWSAVVSINDHRIPYGPNALHETDNPVISTNDLAVTSCNNSYSPQQFNFFFGNGSGNGIKGFLYSQNTRFLKIFKNTDAIKNYSVGRQSVYTSTTYNNLKTDNSVDNSVHISDNDLTIASNNVATTSNTFTTYNSTSVTNITNNVTNNNGISPEQMQELIDSIVKKNAINSGSSSGTGSSSAGTGVSGNSSGSTTGSSGGVTAIVNAIGKLLDVIAMIAGKVIAAFADFIASILKSLDSFTGLTTGFTNFLTNIFGFIPPEIMAIITTGITISILISVIKLLRR